MAADKYKQPKLAQDMVDSRRQRVAELRREGQTMEQIATEVGCSVATVHRDCKELREQWRAKAAGEYSELMAESLENLKAMQEEAWKRLRLSVSSDHPDGNPRWLELARRIEADIGDLLGLQDPVVFQAKRVSESEAAGGRPDIVELVVNSREEVEALRDEHGNISLAAYQQKMLGIAKQCAETR